LKHSLGNIWPDPVLELNLKAGWNRFLFKLVPDCAGDYANSCYTRCRFWPATEPRDYEEKNIAWMVSMPGLSQDTPVICGERIFTMAYPYNLVCLDKKTGKILWIRPNGPYDAATADDRKAKPDLFVKMDALAAKRETYYHNFIAGSMPTPQGVKEENDLEKELDKLMLDVDTRYRRPKEQGEPDWWTIPTPTTDGHNVCVWLTRGISAAYDLEGNRRWICYQRTRDQHHGYFCSPVIADGKFVRYDGQLTALDMNDGSVKWSVDDGKPSYNGSNLWFGSLSRGGILGGKEYIVGPGGAMMVRASDGKVFGKFGYGDATTVFTGDTLLWTIQDFIAASSVKVDSADGGLTITPGKKVSWTRAQLLGCPNMYQGHWLEASPLVYDGLGYAVSGSGVLVVFDAKTMEPVYTKALQLDLFHYAGRSDYVGAAVTLAGHYIYLSGSTGVTVVIKPGRTYEEVARNRIQILTRTAFWEDASTHYPQGATGHTLGDYKYFCYGAKYCPEYQDCTMTSTPIFDGSRMYFRGGQYLYCIEEKGRQ
jgi:outer membrane protein assembly factor BamB